MKCRRICRELLWLARFGEFGPSSQPHLDHLASCRNCRDEVGFDRAMVEQLRIALAQRIENAAPSSGAWERILARAQTPEPRPVERLWGWSTLVLSRLRFATAMAGTGLAMVLALNMEVVPLGTPVTDAATVEAEQPSLLLVPRVPPERSPLADLVEQWGGNDGSASRPDPEAAMTAVNRVPQVGATVAEPATQPQMRIVFRSTQTPDPDATRAAGGIQPDGAPSTRSSSEPGAPS